MQEEIRIEGCGADEILEPGRGRRHRDVSAMTSFGHAAESDYRGPLVLDGDPKAASVLVLGAGLAGMTAAYELRKAGYAVEVLEYSGRAGGRCWSPRNRQPNPHRRRRCADQPRACRGAK